MKGNAKEWAKRLWVSCLQAVKESLIKYIPVTASPPHALSSWKSFPDSQRANCGPGWPGLPAHLHSLSTSCLTFLQWPVRRLCTVILPREASAGFVSWRLLFCLACILSPTPVLVLRYWLLSSAPVLAPLVLSSLQLLGPHGSQLLWVPLLWMVRLAGSEQGKPQTKATAML